MEYDYKLMSIRSNAECHPALTVLTFSPCELRLSDKDRIVSIFRDICPYLPGSPVKLVKNPVFYIALLFRHLV